MYRNVPDFKKLRLRSYSAYATIDTLKIIASKFFYWVVGSGLKLQCEPNRKVLISEGIDCTDEEFTSFQQLVEARFMVYSNSKEMDYMKQKTLHELSNEAHQMEFLGGDYLVICRFDEKGLNVQTVDGEHVENPSIDTNFSKEAELRGNYIDCGIEIDKKGSHVAYYIKVKHSNGSTKSERIEAVGSNSK